jgi:hypothetical protein
VVTRPDHRPTGNARAVARSWRRLPGMAIAILGACISSAALADDDLQLPPDVYGSYAPGGDCAKQPRITVDKAGVHLDTAAGKRGPLPMMVSFSFGGGATYQGIQIWGLVKHGGKDQWGEDTVPVLLTFNANEQRGALTAERNEGPNSPKAVLDGPLTSIVQAASFRLCRTSAAAPAARQAPASAAAAQSPAASFASVVNALMQPASAPEGSYYDWRFIEKAPGVTWAALPPQMLDKRTADGHFFRRNGTITVGGQPFRIMAAGARSMIFNHSFKNEGRALGEDAVLSALRASGLTVTTVRCPMDKKVIAPTWYRLSGNGKHPAILWIAEPRGTASPWEGFNLSLEASLKPMTAQERRVWTDRCA